MTVVVDVLRVVVVMVVVVVVMVVVVAVVVLVSPFEHDWALERQRFRQRQ